MHPGGGGYQVPGYVTPTSNQANALGIVSLIVGILAIPLACCGWGGLFLGVAAVITGVLGINKAKQGLADNRGLALAGIICGGIGAALGTIRLIWSVFDTAITYGSF